MADLDKRERHAIAVDHAESVSVTIHLRTGREISVTADRDGVVPAVPEHALNGRVVELLQQAIRLADEATHEARLQTEGR
jgi:hypothetical protein